MPRDERHRIIPHIFRALTQNVNMTLEERTMARDTQTNGQGTTEKQPTTVQEAGRKGGRRVKEKYGQEFYVEIGKKGGRIIAETRGSDYYAQIGKKGGET